MAPHKRSYILTNFLKNKKRYLCTLFSGGSSELAVTRDAATQISVSLSWFRQFPTFRARLRTESLRARLRIERLGLRGSHLSQGGALPPATSNLLRALLTERLALRGSHRRG